MKYLVWIEENNKIKGYNVFEHYSFYKDAMAVFKRYLKNEDMALFKERVSTLVCFYFRSKAEWEVLIKSIFTSGKPELKVDVYKQIEMNWDLFLVALFSNLQANEKYYDERGERIDED